ALVGTADYIAPEQIEGGSVDARSDVYALGCMTYQLLSGRVPFPRDSLVAKIFAHLNDPAPRLSDVPASLADAVQRAMAKRPEDRFTSAGEFGRAVLTAAAGASVSGVGRAEAPRDAAIVPAPPEREQVAGQLMRELERSPMHQDETPEPTSDA